MPDAPTIPGYKLFNKTPFTSMYGTEGYLLYLSDQPINSMAIGQAATPDGYERWFAGPNDDVPARHVLMYRPRKPPPPLPLPAVTVLVPNVPVGGMRPAGLAKAASNVHVKGFNQNVSVEQDGLYNWTNVRSTHALRNRYWDENYGQGWYLGKGHHVFRECLSGWNGWDTSVTGPKSLGRRFDRTHGWYANVDLKLFDGEHLIAVNNGWAGAQLRCPSRIKSMVCIGNAVGLASIYGPHEWSDVTVYDGGYNEAGGNWAGNCGLMIWGQTTVRDVWIVGAAGGPKVPYPHPQPDHNGAQVYDLGAVKVDPYHPQYPTAPKATLDAKDCLIAGWRPSTTVKSVFDGFDGGGFVVKPDPVAYDWAPVVDAVLRNEINVKDAVRLLRDGIRGQVK